MRDNHQFTCPKCGELHRLETLLEFPLPADISDITSGRRPGEVKSILLQSYLINKSYVLTKCALHINIIDLPDELEIHTWIRIEVAELRQATLKEGSTEEIICTGRLVYPIPLYSLTDYPVVKVNLASEELYPVGKLVLSNEAFRRDWHEGINSQRLIELLAELYHG
ncbi:MAG: DUF2199 domain-containing protein [Bacteroidota bacterium]